MSILKKLSLLLLLISIALTIIYLIIRWHYEPEHTVTTEIKHPGDIISIGIIGDSYVEKQTLDTIFFNAMLRHNVKTKIYSFGEGGANSRLVYKNLFSDKSDPFSSNKLFHNNITYCIVIAGVNDALGQYGSKFYVYHELLIIKSLLKNNIRPVVVSLPEFGIQEEVEVRFNAFKHARNAIFGFFTGNGFKRTIHDYRNALNIELNKQHLKDSIVFINYDHVINNYNLQKNLFRNPPHLNLAGNQRLGSYLAKCIINDIHRKSN